jgi:signal transduction histidine kinase
MLFVITCCAFLARAQEYIPDLHHFSIKEGLSDREINGFLQDRQGFMWFTTRDGLNRFDGYNFRIWTKEDGLGSNFTADPFEDAYGFIWVNDASGATSLMDPKRLTLLPIDKFYGDKIPGGIQGKGYYSYLAKDSTLYLTNARTIRTFHPRRGYREIPILATLGDSSLVFSMAFVSAAKTIWGNLRGLKKLDLVELDSNGRILQQINDPLMNGSFLPTGRHPEGTLNYYKMYGPIRYLEITPDNTTRWVGKDAQFPFLGKSYGGSSLALVNKDGPLYSDFKFFNLKDSTPFLDLTGSYEGVDETHTSIRFDRTGKLWIGTRFGMIAADFQQNHFKRLLYTADAGKPRLSCRGIIEKEGHLIVNTESGIYCDGTLVKESTSAWFGLTNDQKGRLWAGGLTGLAQVIGYPPTLEVHSDGLLYPWTIYSDHRLWIGLAGGLCIYDIANKQLRPFTQYNGFNEAKGAYIVSIQQDRQGNIWFCATTGLYRLDLEKGIMERHWTGGKGNYYLPFDNFAHFYEDSQGVFWLASIGGGLIRWDKQNGAVTQYSKKTGFWNNTVYAVYEDNHQHLWLPSDEGIIQFDKTTGTVRHVFLEENGITNHEFNRTSHYRGSDGTLYFGGLNGVTAFNPDDFYGNNEVAPAPLVISKYSIVDGSNFELADKTGMFYQQNEIVLYPGFRYFELEFALLTFTRTDRIQYSYKIEGLGGDWATQTENRLRINYLPYGTFHLRIRARDPNGNWGANELNIPIQVIRPFWLRWWFFLICALSIAGLIYAWFQYRLEQAVKIERIRVQISSDLHDDVGTLLAGLAMQSEALELSASEKDKSKLHRISVISRNAMTHMRDTVWAIDARKDKLEDLLDRMREHAEETLGPRDIRFDFEISNLSLKQMLPTNIRQNLYLIYKEAVTNAAKHSNGNLVTVQLKKSVEGFEMRIQDNGTVAEKSYKTTGLGTSNMQMRAEKIGGKLRISRDHGFCVILEMGSIS